MVTSRARQIRKVLYRLKRLLGEPITVRNRVIHDVALDTGLVTENFVGYHVRRAIVLDVSIGLKFSFDLAYIASGKNFTYGANYSVGERNLLIDAKDVTGDLTVTSEVVINDKVYQVKSTPNYVESLLYAVTISLLGSEE